MEHKTLLIVVLFLAAIAAASVLLARGPERQTTQAAEAPAGLPKAATDAPANTLGRQGQATPGLGVLQAAEAQTASVPVSPTSALPVHRVVATYFHNTARCTTCRAIEQLARETIGSTFAAEVASGKLVWRALNMEEKENEHYAIGYSLTSPSLVLTEMDGEHEVRFKVLTETWKLAHKKAEFISYVEIEVRAFLEGL